MNCWCNQWIEPAEQTIESIDHSPNFIGYVTFMQLCRRFAALPPGSDVTFCAQSKCSGKNLIDGLIAFLSKLENNRNGFRFYTTALRGDEELFLSLQRRRGRAD